MNEEMKALCIQAGFIGENMYPIFGTCQEAALKNLIELVRKDIHKKVIASIIITDVICEENNKIATSEDYIQAIHKDFKIS